MTDEEVVVKTEGSHRLLLPKDWPIEQKDGRIGPVPVEEYLSLKFGQARERFDDVEERLEGLERRLKALEDEQKLVQKRISTVEQRVSQPEVKDGHTAQSP